MQSTIVFCVESGLLERQAYLLIESMKNYVKSFCELNVICYSPRKHFQPSKEFCSFLNRNRIEHIKDELNKKFTVYPIANKIISSKHAEQSLGCRNIFFLDTDKVIFENIFEKQHFQKSICLSPSYYSNIAIRRGHEIASPWEKLLFKYNITNLEYNKSIYDETENVLYWNSGIVFSSKNDFFYQWNAIFEGVFHELKADNKYNYFIDQISLSILSLLYYSHVSEFDKNVNVGIFPTIEKNKFLPNLINLETVSTIHYGKTFNKYYLFNPFSVFVDSDRKSWLEQKTKLYKLENNDMLRAFKRNFKYFSSLCRQK